MPSLLADLQSRGRLLIVVAAAIEAEAVLRAIDHDTAAAKQDWAPIELTDHVDLVVSGVGKSAAAGATARFLDPNRHAAVLSLGVAGALPDSGLKLKDTVLATQSIFADEGFLTPTGFTDISTAGFPPGPEGGIGVRASEKLFTALRPLADTEGPIATVSTCAGTDDLAAEVVKRTSAIAEAMEGGAVAVTTQRVSGEIWFSELRVISNTTGNRDSQQWDLNGSLHRLGEIAAQLVFSRT